MELFEINQAEQARRNNPPPLLPLPARLRPRNLDEVCGQEHILSEGSLLRRAIQADRIRSLLFYGPPGCGKTTLAEVIANTTRKRFVRTSGILSNVAELRGILEECRERRRMFSEDTLVFVDEIHRFNKAQQDVLLPYLERGDAIFIGATTHNPFFFVNSPLLSRSQVFQLEPLSCEAVRTMLERALKDERAFPEQHITATPEALHHWAEVCDGDARKALSALELAVLTAEAQSDGTIHLGRSIAEESIQKKAVEYDRDEDGHHDTISAFIKSVRGSDPDAAIYWLAKMIYAGEDPRFIARRLVILASEDIGNADPRALAVAVQTLQAVEFIGMPEGRIPLAQATTYLACCPKSNAAYLAINQALKDVEEGRTLPVPKALRSSAYRRAEDLGHQGYQYAHDHPGHFVDQEYVPTEKQYYHPTEQGYEETLKKRLEHWRCLSKKKNPNKS